MNGVKLEHMCHYSVNLSLYCDCQSVVLSQPVFTGHRSQAANVSHSSHHLQIMSFLLFIKHAENSVSRIP